MKSPLGMRRIAGSLARSIASRVPCGRPAPRPLLHSIPHRALTATKGADTASAAAATIHKLNREATSPHSDAILSASDYHFLADGALEELSLLCDGLAEVADTDDEVDVSLSQGVLNINVGSKGFWVVNKQSPNQQLWLSSPISGPKRFEYSYNSEIAALRTGYGMEGPRCCVNWRCTRSGEALLSLLQRELLERVGVDIAKGR